MPAPERKKRSRRLTKPGKRAITAQGMAPGAMGGGFGGAFSVPDRPQSVATDRPGHLAQVEARTSINTLVSAIQSVISPTNWDSVGWAYVD